MISFDMRLRTRADVRLFSATITLIVVVVANVAEYSYMSEAVFHETRVNSNLMAVFLAASISYYVGIKMQRVDELTRSLEYSAHHDHLTAAITRMSFYERCRMESDELFPATLLVLDIDHFKVVNDTHGHDAGDKVLRHIARVIARNCRATDLVTRFGGEEFLVLMPGAGEVSGQAAAERIRLRIAAAPVVSDGYSIAVTVSIGAVHVRMAEQIDEAVRAADAALYLAKKSGRNRVMAAPALPMDDRQSRQDEPQPESAAKPGGLPRRA